MEKAKVALSPSRWLLLLTIPIAWCFLSNLGMLDPIERKLLEWRFRDRGERDSAAKVVYVDIDGRSLDEIGGWPWDRAYFAEVASSLIEKGGAKAVGIDLLLSDRDRVDGAKLRRLVEGNSTLAGYLNQLPPVVVGASYAVAPLHDVGTQRPTILDLPHVIYHALFRRAVADSPGEKTRHTTRALPLLDREPLPVERIEPPALPSLLLAKNQSWVPPRVGLIDTDNGGAGGVPAYVPSSDGSFHTLALELALAYWDLTPEAVKIHDDRIDLVGPDGVRRASIPLLRRQLVEVNWFSAWNSPTRNPRFGFSTVLRHAQAWGQGSLADKIHAQDFFAQPVFKDAVVLIGPVDPLLNDLAPTPFDDLPVPQVGVHGNLLKTILTGNYLHRLPSWADDAVLFGLTMLISRLVTVGGVKGSRFKLTAALILTAYSWMALWIFRAHDVVVPLGATLGAVFTTAFAAIVWQMIREERQKRRIKGMFGTYVSPQLVQRMIDSGETPQLGGHKQELTAYFSDIASFSRFSEILDSGPLVELMNEYLTACTDIIEEESGTVDKYIGDAVMAMFGAPVSVADHAYRSCLAAQRVQDKLGELRRRWRSEGEKWPPLVWGMRSRIGLNSGFATVGNMGSRSRLNYTVMGDNVNLAARMESGAKHYGVGTMVTEATKLACEDYGGDTVVFRYLDRIVVKGRSLPVRIYELVGLKDGLAMRTRECLEWFARGVERYLARDWAGAADCFSRSEPLELNRPGGESSAETTPSLVYLDRCAQMLLNPPGPEWEGTYLMKEK